MAITAMYCKKIRRPIIGRLTLIQTLAKGSSFQQCDYLITLTALVVPSV
jgi:hypothetical protein